MGVKLYNNTLFRADNASGWRRLGIDVGESVTASVAHYNPVPFPATGDTINPAALTDASADLTASHHLLDESPGFCDPEPNDGRCGSGFGSAGLLPGAYFTVPDNT